MQVLISKDRIQSRMQELARLIAADYQGQHLTLLGILTGSLMFLADLVRQLDLPSRIGFIQASSYRGATTQPGKLELVPGLIPDVRDRNVLLLDDILDTGRTLTQAVDYVRGLGPKSLRVAVLLRKIGRQELPLEPDYCGFEIPNAFVVGYGLDYNDEFRQPPDIAILDEPHAGLEHNQRA
jgi:hypoxanthine phosphoribosyltransferase